MFPTRPSQSQIWSHSERVAGVWRLPHSLLLCLLLSWPSQLDGGALQLAGEEIFPHQLDPHQRQCRPAGRTPVTGYYGACHGGGGVLTRV